MTQRKLHDKTKLVSFKKLLRGFFNGQENENTKIQSFNQTKLLLHAKLLAIIIKE